MLYRLSLALISCIAVVAACGSEKAVQTRYEGRMDSTTVEVVTDLSETKGSTVSDLSNLKIRWRARCPGRSASCQKSSITAVLQYVGRDFQYSPDAKLEVWAAQSQTYQKVWSGYATGRESELGRGLAGQALTYRLSTDTLQKATSKARIRLATSEEGSRSMYELTTEQKKDLKTFLSSLR